MFASSIKKIIPQSVFQVLQLPYHYLLAFLGAVIFGFPSRKLNVIAVTGTKGKSSVVELVGAILEEAGFRTAHASTIHFKIANKLERNLHKMTMPGRFFLQHFLRKAVHAGCTHAVIEMTSEGARQFRHKFIALDALIFTNLAPEHIESHGSYENYVAAKVSLARALEKSRKPHHPSIPSLEKEGRQTTGKFLVVNGDDAEAQKFLDVFSGIKVVYSKQDAIHPVVSADGVSFNWLKPAEAGSPLGRPSENGLAEHSVVQNVLGSGVRIDSKLPGEFNLYNILAAISYAKAAGVPLGKIQAGIAKVKSIRGRAEKIALEESATTPQSPPWKGGEEKKFDFTVIVDYAHTPDSLEKLYQTYSGKFRICVLGNTGGGRDKWKRPVMASIAEKYCDEIILTNEDPYDEDPEHIIREMAAGMGNNPPGQPPLLRGIQPTLILARRAAIRAALEKASKGDVVLITGKGTDPYIMGPRGSKEPWDDATVAREELTKILAQRNS